MGKLDTDQSTSNSLQMVYLENVVVPTGIAQVFFLFVFQ